MAKYPQSCTLKWLGYASAENSANISFDYTSGNLDMGVVITGTPIVGFACAICARPLNFKLKSGMDVSELWVDGGNFNKYLPIEVTPTSDYIGKQLDFAVSISAALQSVLYAKVGW